MVKEYRQADENGKFALSAREYKAVRAIYSAVDALAREHTQLERRCKGYKNGWRDLRCLVKLSEKVLDQVLATIPYKKLLQMQKDLEHTICKIETRGAVGVKDEGFMYVPEESVIELAKAAMKINCFGCTKTHKEAKKTCDLYKTIQSAFCYEFEECGECPFSDEE